MSGRVAIPRLRTMTRIPKGPKALSQPVVHTDGPGAAPPGFVVGQTSASEWNLYWALAKVFGEPKDPRIPPFTGGYPYWGYQVPTLGQYTRAPGSAVVDYVIYTGNTRVGIRLQTFRFHLQADAAKKAYDALQLFRLERIAQVIDIFEEDVLGDPSGEKYVVTAKRALGLIQRIDPIVAGIDPRLKVLKGGSA